MPSGHASLTEGVTRDIRLIFSGAGISAVGKGTNALAQFVFYIVLARELGAYSAGIYFLGFALFQFGSQFALLSLDNVARRYVPLVGNPIFLLKRSGLILGTTASVFLVAAALFVVVPERPLLDGASAEYMLPFAVAAFFAACVNMQIGFFNGLKRVLPGTVVWEVFYPLFRLVLFSLLVFMGFRLGGAVSAFLASALMAAIFGHLWLMREIRGGQESLAPVRHATPGIGALVTYAVPMTAARLMGLALAAGLPLLLGSLADAETVAQYGIAFRVVILAQLAIVAVNGLLAPTLSEYSARGSSERLESLSQISATLLMVGVGPMLVFFLLFPSLTMELFGNEFARGASFLQVLALGQLLVLMIGGCDQILFMTGRAREMLFASTTGGIVGISVALLGFPVLGGLSFAVGMVCGMALSQLIAFYLVWDRLKVMSVGKEHIAIASVCWITGLAGFTRLELVWRIAAFGLFVAVILAIAIFRLKIFDLILDRKMRVT